MYGMNLFLIKKHLVTWINLGCSYPTESSKV